MPVAVNVIVACTDRKAIRPQSSLQLRNVGGTGADERASAWIRTLERTQDRPVAARNLYQGEHWAEARSWQKMGRFRLGTVRVWVASAGYGLIHSDTPIEPYSATFAASQPDSVTRDVEGRQYHRTRIAWWKALSMWRGPVRASTETPRSIGAIALDEPGTPILIAASGNYLSAMEEDIVSARDELNDPAQLIVISAGVKGGRLADNLLPVDAKLQSLVGGSRIGLNARITSKVLAESAAHPLNMDALGDRYRRLSAKLPAPSRYDRKTLSEAQVREFAQALLASDPKMSASAGLRSLRAKGFACEQSRFGSIFNEVRLSSHGAR